MFGKRDEEVNPISTKKWTKMWHKYAIEYYSSIKKNKVKLIGATWIDPEIVILSEANQTRQILYDIAYMWDF